MAEGSRWQVGDEVIAIAPAAFGSHTIVRESLVARKPRRLTYQQAAAIPIAFMTADYALNQCGSIASWRQRVDSLGQWRSWFGRNATRSPGGCNDFRDGR
ncbi:MAG: hypothetical protein R3C56_37550 [Pirellulaceae bacterium]